MTYFFSLGRIHDLAQAELEAVLPRFSQTTNTLIGEETLMVESLAELDCKAVMDVLGGTIKITQVLQEFDTPTGEDLQSAALAYIASQKIEGSKLLFSLSSVNLDKEQKPDPQAIKEKLKEQGISCRYLDNTSHGLGAAQLTHHNIVELQFTKQGEKIYMARTQATQDIDDWSKRDYGKPYRDPKKGMLPPKLARIMANLAVSTRDPSDVTILDPFCGTGTVLMEAAMIGCPKVNGTDLDDAAIHGTGLNMHWFTEQYKKTTEYTLSVQDVMQLTQAEKVDCIVTEPFLGKSKPTEESSANTLKGLEKMYLGMLKSFAKVLKKNGTVVIVIPVYVFEDRVKTLNVVIDRLESLGYTREKGPFRYSRPQSIVQRDIFVLRHA